MGFVNRGLIKRRMIANRVIAKVNYSYTDDYAWDAATDFGNSGWAPAVFDETVWGYRWVDNTLVFGPDWFKGYGSAWTSSRQEGDITFLPYQNLSFEMRILDAPQEKVCVYCGGDHEIQTSQACVAAHCLKKNVKNREAVQNEPV